MNLALLGLAVVLLILLAAVRAFVPSAPSLSEFETARRVKLRDDRGLLERRRERARPALVGLRRIVSAILVFGLFWTIAGLIGVPWACVITAILIIAGGAVEGRVPRLYARIEPALLTAAESRVVRLLPVSKPDRPRAAIASTEELVHEVGRASFLDASERDAVNAALEFPRLSVRDVMRPRKKLESIDKGEVLGPLVIDDLYKTGEAVFLVTDGGLDHVVGLLPLDKLTGLELTASPNALKAMDGEVEFIGESAPLGEALATLRRTGAPLLVVQTSDGATAGTVSLAEIIDRLLGE